MATIWHNLNRHLQKLRWKLTASYTAVTVGSLLVAVFFVGLLVFSRVLVPRNLLAPEAWVEIVSESVSPTWQHILSQKPVDTDLIDLMLREVNVQSTHFDLLVRLGDLQLVARTAGRGNALVVGADGILLGASNYRLVSADAIGQPLDPTLLPGLDESLHAALSGVTEPQRLAVTLEPNESFYVVVPVMERDLPGDVLGAVILLVQSLPTDNDIPANMLALVGKSLLVLMLAAGLVGAVFGSLTARGMARRLGQISTTSEAWSQGSFDQFIDDSAPDEIGQLARRLDSMARQLQTLLNRRQEMAISEERNRLARDLHDSAKQQALAASFQLGTALTLFDGDTNRAHEHLLQADALIDSVRIELTDLIHELRPPDTVGKSLADMLDEYATEWAHCHGIEMRQTVEGQGTLPLESEQALLRIAQEALSNIARHSGASSVELHLTHAPDTVTLTIADHGQGFDAQQRFAGMGLHSMRERAQSLAGTLTIDSERGQGTRVSVVLQTS